MLQNGTTPAGGAGPSLNADGSLVAFESGNQSLAANDPSATTIDIIVRNMSLGVNEAASTSGSRHMRNLRRVASEPDREQQVRHPAQPGDPRVRRLEGEVDEPGGGEPVVKRAPHP